MSIYTRAWYWENFAERTQRTRGSRPQLSQDDRSRVQTMLHEVAGMAATDASPGFAPATDPTEKPCPVRDDVPASARRLDGGSG